MVYKYPIVTSNSNSKPTGVFQHIWVCWGWMIFCGENVVKTLAALTHKNTCTIHIQENLLFSHPRVLKLHWHPRELAALTPKNICCCDTQEHLLHWHPRTLAALTPKNTCCIFTQEHLLLWHPRTFAVLTPNITNCIHTQKNFLHWHPSILAALTPKNTYGINTQVFNVACKSFIKPEISPPAGCDQVTKPLVSQLMWHNCSYTLLVVVGWHTLFVQHCCLPAQNNVKLVMLQFPLL